MNLTASPTELTTAVTDAVLGVLCLGLLWALAGTAVRRRWQRAVWASVFVALAIGSFLGALAHGFEWSSTVRDALWQPLYLSLGLTVALFFVGGIGDWRGERPARAVLPWALAAAFGFFALTQFGGGGFTLFVVYEGAAMLATFAMYISLWRTRRLPGAGTVAAGVALTLAAAAVQTSDLELRIVWPFDHNGLFHLVQIAAVLVISSGVRASLTAADEWRRKSTR